MVIADLQALADAEKRAFFPRFFKTGPGQYGEGDEFLGVTVPHIRAVVKIHRGLPLSEVETLLQSPVHECRLAALLLLVDRYARGDEAVRAETARFYLKHLDHVNNWDLVDSSADKILGAWLDETGDTARLDILAASEHLWRQRVAMIATFYFIRKGEFSHTFRIADILLQHEHDLMHKAVGWMLREVGKRDQRAEEAFLLKRYKTMPRTMLRYAIEKFEEGKRKRYLRGEV